MAIEIVDFRIKNGDFPLQNVSLPEGNQRHMSHFFLGVLQAVPRIVGSRQVAVLAVGFIVLRLLNACQAFLMSLVWSMVTGQHPVN